MSLRAIEIAATTAGIVFAVGTGIIAVLPIAGGPVIMSRWPDITLLVLIGLSIAVSWFARTRRKNLTTVSASDR